MESQVYNWPCSVEFAGRLALVGLGLLEDAVQDQVLDFFGYTVEYREVLADALVLVVREHRVGLETVVEIGWNFYYRFLLRVVRG